MQVIFYLTDAMKYEIRPQVVGPTSTTVRPTQPHRPGNYAPEKPPGPQAYFAEEPNYKPWKSPPQGLYINKKSNYQVDQQYVSELLKDALPEGLDVLSAAPAEILHQINALGDFDTIGDDDHDALRFALNYDDVPNLEFLRQKKVPPTRAYVTLLSLYDLLNKEAKEKNLNKYNVSIDFISSILLVPKRWTPGIFPVDTFFLYILNPLTPEKKSVWKIF